CRPTDRTLRRQLTRGGRERTLRNTEVLELKGAREVGVELVDPSSQTLVQRNPVEPAALLGRPDQDGEVLAPVADDHGLLNEGTGLEAHLDGLRTDGLAAAGDDDVLGPTDELNLARGV